MRSDRAFFIHVGTVKTGTTALQRAFFPFLSGIEYFGKVYSDDAGAAVTHLLHDPDFDAARFCRPFQTGDNRPGLISDESFTPARPGDEPPIHRLKQVFPNSKIMLVLRDQIDLAPSLYNEYHLSRPQFSREHYLSWLEDAMQPHSQSHLSLFHYDRILTAFEQVYAREEIGVFSHREFRESQESFLKKLAAFMGLQFADLPTLPTLHSRGLKQMKHKKARSLYTQVRSAFLPNTNLRRFLRFGVEDAIKLWERKQSLARQNTDLTVPAEAAARLREHFGPGNFTVSERYGVML